MDRFERLATAIAGGAPDRVPVSVWFHFGSEHLSPEAVARLHADYYRAYRWDFLKVMFDYRLDLPGRVDDGPEIDLDALLHETDWAAPFARQRDVLAILCTELGREVPIVETVFSPWMCLVRHLGGDRRDALLARPDLLAAILDRLCEETCRHVDALRELAIEGVFFATLAGNVAAGGAEFEAQAPRDRAILDRAHGLTRFLHLHGSGAGIAHLADYPREVLHRDHGAADDGGLGELRRTGERAIMGGLPADGLTRMSLAAIRSRIAGAVDAAGKAGFILAPGCTVSPTLARRTMLAIRDGDHLGTGTSGPTGTR
ncbi:MAG: uroporphyrinogen decarboxylase family protein [Bauldia sp.]